MSRDDGALARLFHEARAVALLDHPSIVGLYDYGEIDGFPFAVYEYVPGHDLRRLIDNPSSALAIRTALQLGKLLAEALAHAHGRGVIHRDLKPENILLPNPLGTTIKLTDFGLATVYGLPVAMDDDRLFLTPAYASPEQALERPGDERTDLYALGVVLYETLCGRPPFEAVLPASLLYQHVYVQPPPPSRYVPALSDGVNRLLGSMLEKQPDRRPASAAEVAEAIAAELEEEQ